MRSLRYLPLAFVAGVHGFLLFAPYAAFCIAAVHLIERRRTSLRLKSIVAAAAPAAQPADAPLSLS